MEKKLIEAAYCLDNKTGNRVSEYLNKLNFKQNEFQNEKALLGAYKKKSPAYIVIDITKVSDKLNKYLSEYFPDQTIIFIKADADSDAFIKTYKESFPKAFFTVLNKSVKYEEFSQAICDLDIEKSRSSNMQSLAEEQERFKFIKFLGSGKEGTVNLFNDNEKNQLVAMKQIKLEGMNEQSKNLIREKEELAMKIKCPTIIELMYTKEEDQNRYTYMEYAHGGTLNEFLFSLDKTGVNLSVEEILNWYVQCLIAIKTLQSMNLCHRDIKPDNILLCENPNAIDKKDKKNMIVKISDLGISKVMIGQGQNTVIGTLYYVAPEVIAEMSYSMNVDLWSLAVMIYEITFKKKPFFEMENEKLQVQIRYDDVQDKLPASLDYRLKYLLKDQLKKNPEARMDVNEILSLSFIKDKMKELNTNFPLWKTQYSCLNEIDLLPTIQCPEEDFIFNETHINLLEKSLLIIESITPKPYKKGFMGVKYTTSLLGSDLEEFIEEMFEKKDNKIREQFISNLLTTSLLINISNSSNEVEELVLSDYYVFSFNNNTVNYDNQILGNINTINNQTDLVFLAENLVRIAIELKKIIGSDKNTDNDELNRRYIDLIYGISLFSKFSLLSHQFSSIDQKHAFFLNLYQIMIIHSLVKEKLDFVKKKGIIDSLIKNNISINYKFEDTTINNLELRHGLFRENSKPKENYLKILASNDNRIKLMENIEFGAVDYLIVCEFFTLEYIEHYQFRIFTQKLLDEQFKQYLIDFFNSCYEHGNEEIKISKIYEKYWDLDFLKGKRLFEDLFTAYKYNSSLKKEREHLALKRTDKKLIDALISVEKVMKNIDSGVIKIVFE